MAINPTVLIIILLLVHTRNQPVHCDTNSGTNTTCQGTECTPHDFQDVQTTAYTQLLQNLTSTIGNILENQLLSHNCAVSDLDSLPSSKATPKIARDCADIAADGHSKNGVYTVQPKIHPLAHDEASEVQFPVYCDLENDGGGWTVFHHRRDGSVDFYRGWAAYKQGFGYLESEFWLGLDRLHMLTTQAHYELLINLEDLNGNKAHARYDTFRIGDESTAYKLILGDYQGTAQDSLRVHNNMRFTTKDRDNDVRSSSNCANLCKGAWWYQNCIHSNLNGLYLPPGQVSGEGMTWYKWKQNTNESLKSSEMKIRRIK